MAYMRLYGMTYPEALSKVMLPPDFGVVKTQPKVRDKDSVRSSRLGMGIRSSNIKRPSRVSGIGLPSSVSSGVRTMSRFL